MKRSVNSFARRHCQRKCVFAADIIFLFNFFVRGHFICVLTIRETTPNRSTSNAKVIQLLGHLIAMLIELCAAAKGSPVQQGYLKRGS